MTEKCNKYEAIFTFGNEEMMKSHLQNCPECQKEQEQMDKVSDLLKEVKPFYVRKRKSHAKLKMACAVFAILLSGAVLGVVNLNPEISDVLKYGTSLSADDFGFPVDSYGLLMVE